ncbi:hypothetical protein [Sphingomonas cavernae]|uniref:Uncharacterized protein n=1 Tax=Sphingomonas cavernae TaxID=2320861 RepID=A0A418WKC3_9SPHN|nr:hypothetical protein [Sphingomonas cavernae]RJF90497.1 hypothetical protein D3876_09675 [Sphingomonas cavernae]
MKSPTMIAALVLAAAGASPVAAQENQRMLVIYGDDECPRGADEDEIVVCARHPESERYRIPERFREKEISPQNGNESWAVRAEALEYAGRTGINSCSVVGPGGWTGCYAEMLRIAQAERRQAARERARVP